MWIIFIILIEFVITLFLSYVLFCVFWPQGMWDLSSQTSDPTGTLCVGRQSPNHWTTRESLLDFCIRFYVEATTRKGMKRKGKGELQTSKRKKEEKRVLCWVISKLFPSSPSLTHHHALLLTVLRTTSVPFCYPLREASIHKPRKSHW